MMRLSCSTTTTVVVWWLWMTVPAGSVTGPPPDGRSTSGAGVPAGTTMVTLSSSVTTVVVWSWWMTVPAGSVTGPPPDEPGLPG
jgi:hypothetical protein